MGPDGGEVEHIVLRDAGAVQDLGEDGMEALFGRGGQGEPEGVGVVPPEVVRDLGAGADDRGHLADAVLGDAEGDEGGGGEAEPPGVEDRRDAAEDACGLEPLHPLQEVGFGDPERGGDPGPGARHQGKVVLKGVEEGEVEVGVVRAPGVFAADLAGLVVGAEEAVAPAGRDGGVAAVRPRPAAAADRFIPAPPAFSGEAVGVAEGLEEGGGLPDLGEGGGAEGAGAHREVGAGGDLAGGVDPAVGDAGQAAAAPPGVLDPGLFGDAAELRGAGRADAEAAVPVAEEDLPDQVLVCMGAAGAAAPAGLHGKEDLVVVHAEGGAQGEDAVHVVQGRAGGRHVDPHADPFLPAVPDRRNRPFPDAGNAAEGVVRRRVRGVEADGDRPDPGPGEAVRRRPVEEVAARAHGHDEAAVGAVAGDIEDVLTHQGFAAAQDDDRAPGGGDLVEDAEGFFGGEGALGLVFAGVGVAVGAFEGAAEGDVPGDQGRGRGCAGGGVVCVGVARCALHLFLLRVAADFNLWMGVITGAAVAFLHPRCTGIVLERCKGRGRRIEVELYIVERRERSLSLILIYCTRIEAHTSPG